MAHRHKNRRDSETRDHLGSLAKPLLRSPPIKHGSIRDTALRLLEDRRLTDPLFHEEAKSYLRGARRLSVAQKVDPRREYLRQEHIKKLAFNKKYNRHLGPFHFKLFDKTPPVPDRVQFRVPHMVAMCVRRKIRREVMHALDHTHKRKGRGGGRRHERAKWNEFSLIKC
ncbi:MAG: hypothetical protein [Microviridae sp.]|nr:MAG: hypothetical protein [Microviridae sp.]